MKLLNDADIALGELRPLQILPEFSTNTCLVVYTFSRQSTEKKNKTPTRVGDPSGESCNIPDNFEPHPLGIALHASTTEGNQNCHIGVEGDNQPMVCPISFWKEAKTCKFSIFQIRPRFKSPKKKIPVQIRLQNSETEVKPSCHKPAVERQIMG